MNNDMRNLSQFIHFIKHFFGWISIKGNIFWSKNGSVMEPLNQIPWCEKIGLQDKHYLMLVVYSNRLLTL